MRGTKKEINKRDDFPTAEWTFSRKHYRSAAGFPILMKEKQLKLTNCKIFSNSRKPLKLKNMTMRHLAMQSMWLKRQTDSTVLLYWWDLSSMDRNHMLGRGREVSRPHRTSPCPFSSPNRVIIGGLKATSGCCRQAHTDIWANLLPFQSSNHPTNPHSSCLLPALDFRPSRRPWGARTVPLRLSSSPLETLGFSPRQWGIIVLELQTAAPDKLLALWRKDNNSA